MKRYRAYCRSKIPTESVQEVQRPFPPPPVAPCYYVVCCSMSGETLRPQSVSLRALSLRSHPTASLPLSLNEGACTNRTTLACLACYQQLRSALGIAVPSTTAILLAATAKMFVGEVVEEGVLGAGRRPTCIVFVACVCVCNCLTAHAKSAEAIAVHYCSIREVQIALPSFVCLHSTRYISLGYSSTRQYS